MAGQSCDSKGDPVHEMARQPIDQPVIRAKSRCRRQAGRTALRGDEVRAEQRARNGGIACGVHGRRYEHGHGAQGFEQLIAIFT